MSERVSSASSSHAATAAAAAASSSSSSSSFLRALIDSIKIILRNKQLFLSIYTLLALPLSLLLFSLSFSSFPAESRVLHLEYLASFSSTRFEARHVWQEARAAALSLLHCKLLYFLPTYPLSLLSAVSSVVSAHHYHLQRSPISLKSALSAVKPIWFRPVLTSICIYALLLLYYPIPLVLSATIGKTNPQLGFLIRGVGSGVEVYLMAVMGMGLVVSILERRSGWDAIQVGSGLMEGRRICGWALSGLLAVSTGWIGWRMEKMMVQLIAGEDLSRDSDDGTKWTALMVVGGWERVWLVGLYGLVVVFGYVVSTVFYCECRKRHAAVREDVDEDEEMAEKVDFVHN